jgi:3-hydroxyisobutyrate dehydrogenase-like beta-hydroxyacid dehydrogenase
MAGGDADVFDRAAPVIDCYAKAITRIGPVGSGQLAKMVNQICIAGIVQGLSEGLHFAQCAGLDPAVVIESISKGAAQSWQMENRWQTMVNNEFEFGFAVDWMRKEHRARRSAAEWRPARNDKTRRSILRRGAGDGWQSLGYIESHRAPEKGVESLPSQGWPAGLRSIREPLEPDPDNAGVGRDS